MPITQAPPGLPQQVAGGWRPDATALKIGGKLAAPGAVVALVDGGPILAAAAGALAPLAPAAIAAPEDLLSGWTAVGMIWGAGASLLAWYLVSRFTR